MLMLRRIALTALLAAPATLLAQDRQTQRDAFTLSERVPAGQWIRVRNMNGDVRVRASNSDKVEVVGTKTWRRGDP
jgi:Ni/Co efflux regulator RcnB